MATDKTFDFKRYSAPPDSDGAYTLQDGSDTLAMKGFVISFHHLPSNRSVYFKAFITQFNESYAPDWSPETVYGRADPIYFFKNTTRSISLGFKIPAASEGEAYENLARVQELIQFLYPSYTDVQNANTISQSPLVRLKVMNLLQQSSTNADPGGDYSELFKAYKSTNDSSKGLLGVISSLAITHNLENDTAGVFEKDENTILPKLIDITMDFKPIHEHPVGWHHEESTVPVEGNTEGKTTTVTSVGFAEDTLFPYGVASSVDVSDIDLDSAGMHEVDLDDPDDPIGGGSLEEQSDAAAAKVESTADTALESSRSGAQNSVFGFYDTDSDAADDYDADEYGSSTIRK